VSSLKRDLPLRLASPRSWSERLRPFGLAIGLTIAGLGVRAATDRYIGDQLPYLTFFIAVVATAYLGGFAPSLLACALGYVAARWFFIEPRFTLQAPGPGARLHTIAYFAGSVLICGMSVLASRAQTRARAATVELGRRQRRLEAEIVEREAVERALRDSDRRKDEFLAVLSHELRNPLAAIRSAQDVLQRASPASEQAMRARTIIGRQVEHLARMVDDLLDVTRIARGKTHLRRATVELRGLVQRTVEDHAASMTTVGLQVEVRMPRRPIWVDGDATRLAQVVGNLLHNAAKFTPAGGQVIVGMEDLPETGTVRVFVRDSGPGLDGEMQGRLFQPFAQGQEGLDRAGGGLGLGLALVKGFVELHGGTAAAHSDGPGRGCEVSFTLPLHAGPPVSEGGRSPPRVVATRRRILVIEDSDDAAETLRDVLELAGHQVDLAPDGAAGIEMVRRGRPDVVLCDIGLPGMSGYDVARALRAAPLHYGGRLVALTGYASPEDERRAAEAGFDQHVAKPASIDQLTAIVVGAGA